jgi:hypothetical protein
MLVSGHTHASPEPRIYKPQVLYNSEVIWVATTQLAMRHGPAVFHPQWEGLHDNAETLWRPENRVVSQDSMGTIAEAQRAYCRRSAQARADALLDSLQDGTEDGKGARARLLSCACRPASAWLDTIPLSRALELKSGEF